MAYLLPSTTFAPLERDGYVYVAGQLSGWVVRIRRVDIETARAEARERGAKRLEWWLGPSSPAGAEEELLAAGFVPDEVPRLTGMTCVSETPAAEHIDVRTATPEAAKARSRVAVTSSARMVAQSFQATMKREKSSSTVER